MTIVGTAEVIVRANTKGFSEELDEGTAPGLASLEEKSGVAGAAAGDAAGVGFGKKVSERADGAFQDVNGKWHKATGQFMSDSELAAAGLSSKVDKAGEDIEKAGKKGHGAVTSMLEGLGVPASLMSGWVGVGVAAAGVVTAIGAGAIDMGMKMQTADAAIATSEGITVKAAANIGNAFLDTAMKSEFSGKQMAESYATVAGQLKSTEGHALNTKEALDVMNASADLATATGVDLATSTQTVAGILQAFQLPAHDAAHATDVLFNSARMTGQSVDQIGNAMEKVRAKMGAFAPPLSDLGGLLVDLTNHGETGRAAMTALGSMFTGLLPPIGKMTKAQEATVELQKEMGVHFTDTAGKLLPFGDIIAEVEPKIKGMGDAQAVATLKALGFGAASDKLLTTIQAGPAAYDKAAAAVSKVGSAHEGAAKMGKTLHVEIATLKSGFDDLLTTLGEKLLPVAQKVLAWFTALIAKVVKDWPQISATIEQVWREVEPVFSSMFAATKMVWRVLGDFVLFVVDVFTGKWHAAWHAIADSVDTQIHFIENLLGKMLGGLDHMLGGLPSKVWKDCIWPIIKFFIDLPGEIAHAIEHGAGDVLKAFEKLIPGGGIIGGVLHGIGSFLHLAEGGVVSKPTIALIGEAGPEAVIPLKGHRADTSAFSAFGRSAPSSTASSSSGIGTVNVYVHDTRATATEIVREMGYALKTGRMAVR